MEDVQSFTSHLIMRKIFVKKEEISPIFKKLSLGFFVSSIFLIILFNKVDLNEFNGLWAKIDGVYIIPFFSVCYISSLALSLRWYFLTNKKLSFRHCVTSNMISIGGNLILPVRGGDLFRVYYSKRYSSHSTTEGLALLFLERVLDFVVITFLGLLSLLWIAWSRKILDIKILFFAVTLLVVLIVILAILRYWNSLVIYIAEYAFDIFKKEHLFKSYLHGPISNLETQLTIKKAFIPLLLTVSLWLGLYAGYYILMQNILGINLSYSETILILFLAAISMSVPAAPSGIGIFHSAVVSGFILTGHLASRGLVFATILHLSQIVFFSSIAIFYYLNWLRQSEREEPAQRVPTHELEK